MEQNQETSNSNSLETIKAEFNSESAPLVRQSIRKLIGMFYEESSARLARPTEETHYQYFNSGSYAEIKEIKEQVESFNSK